ncbi:Beta-barrel assembly machine subunit BamE [Poseidonocella pacifica]|uniref:Beta-barrel assembly machine subunit BamE n=1 Tax=Poseidonocella pacifica TaxID=871651 RepID=A0A1I0VKV0_9RHOB|nr:outer membrane protein assembly factor BamE [Poseidonocella pacifica]SFA77089.1 Beta-barrel assembly machine subunit BamE [Poseidonocella pacifica]
MAGRTRGLRIALGFGAALMLSACVAQYRNHGYVPADEALAAVNLGQSRASVIATLGSPTAAAPQDEDGIFYASSRVRHFGFLAPEIIDRQVVVISFGSSGGVSNVERFTLEDGRIVPLTRRVTDNTVRNTTFLRQLLGNLGRFDAGTILGEE